LRAVVEAGAEGFKENIRINSLLEDKAQKTAGLAGIFLAAALAFIKVENLMNWPFNRYRVLIPLVISIVLLVCCIGFCLAVMWVRSMPGYPSLAALEKFRFDLSQLEDTELADYEEGYWHDRAALWGSVLGKQFILIASKAARLRKAQVCLATAMSSVGLLLLFLITPIIGSLK
jgi:hypothetical protein